MDSASSLAREERIAKRRTRLAERLRAKERAEEDGSDSAKASKPESEERDLGRGAQQTKRSNQRMEREADAAEATVTQVRIVSDQREQDRLTAEQKADRERQAAREAEHLSSAQQTEMIAPKWEILGDHTLPEDLQRAIDEQRADCSALIEQKDKLIRDYRDELKHESDEYAQTLKKQAEDIDLLLKRMRQNLSQLRYQYDDELREIERAYMQEYQELIEHNREENDTLMERRRDLEVKFMEQRQERIEEQQRQLDALRTQDAEEFSIIKVKLETWLQDLEQQLEQMRAVYQLNNEKLIYNVQVLKDRGTENQNTINVQKKKITRLQDVLSNLKAKYHQVDKEYRQRNINLTEEYRRITEQFKDLQNKNRHFAQADNLRFQNVWRNNEEQVVTLVRRLLQADKIITEQQLGWDWVPPVDVAFDPSFSLLEGHTLEGDGEAVSRKVEPSELENEDESLMVSQENVKLVMDILATEGGFLMDDKVRRAVQDLSSDAGELVKFDAIVRALRIGTQEEMTRLIKTFTSTTGNGDEPTVLDPDDVAAAIRKYIAESGQRAGLKDSTAAVDGDEEHNAQSVVRTVAAEKAEEAKQREFWDRIANIVPERTERVWKVLEKAMGQYDQLLLDRSKLANSCGDLRRQNDELKGLLNSYLTAKVNDDLEIPPIQTLGGATTNIPQ